MKPTDEELQAMIDGCPGVTEEMDNAAQECPSTYECWTAMLNASALGPKP